MKHWLRRTQNRNLHAVLLLALVFSPACTKAPPNLQPQETRAFNNARIIKSIDVLRDIAVEGSKQTPPIIATSTMLKVVRWHRSALLTIDATTLGAKAALLTGLLEVQRDLPPNEEAVLGPYLTLARTVIQEVLP